MCKKLFFVAVLFFASAQLFAQQIPVGMCGIVCIYDANGARVKRVYFCNNGTDPYPSAVAPGDSVVVSMIKNIIKSDLPNEVNVLENVTKNNFKNYSFQVVDVLYPNPTTGVFNINFSKTLNKATVFIVDINGKTLKTFKANGAKIIGDLSALPAGTYFVKIDDGGIILKNSW